MLRRRGSLPTATVLSLALGNICYRNIVGATVGCEHGFSVGRHRDRTDLVEAGYLTFHFVSLSVDNGDLVTQEVGDVEFAAVWAQAYALAGLGKAGDDRACLVAVFVETGD